MHDQIEQKIVDVLVNKLNPYMILLFGSTVNGATHDESDIDVAFLSDISKFDKYEIFMIAQQLASTLNQDVDLIDLSEANTVFQAQILHTGKVIYCSDYNKKAEYEIKTFKMYTRLNEERSQILKNIEESGSIYEK